MTPWFRRVTDIRLALYTNATDRSRKDQWVWMKRYEKMLTDAHGEEAKFLPNDEEKPSGKRTAAAEPADPGEAIVTFE